MRMRSAGLDIKRLLPAFATVRPNGETLHMADRATRFTPSQSRNLGALSVGKGI